MIISYLLLELLLGAVLLGFIAAYKKRLIDRIVLLATVPLAFIAAIIVTKFAFTIPALSEIIATALDSIGMNEELKALVGMFCPIAFPIIATVVFWLLLVLFRILAGIVLSIVHSASGCKAREREAKAAYKEAKREGRDANEEDAENSIFKRYKKPLWHKLTTGAVGAVSGFLIIMLSMLPVVYISDIAEPAVEKALAAESDGTYASELAKTVDENFLIISEKTVFGKIQKYTGMRAVTSAAVTSLTDAEVELENGKTAELNLAEVLATLADNGVSAMVTYERICASGATLKSMAPISNILLLLSENDSVVNFGFVVFDSAKEYIMDGEGSQKFEYDVDSAESLRKDLAAAAGLVDIVSTDLGDLSFDSSTLLNDILAYLEDEESANKLVNTIGEASAFKTNFPKLMEYALGMIADQLDLPEDKADDYEMFIADMTEALNNKTFGTYDEEKVEYFITYSSEHGLNVETYTVANRDEPTELDVAYLNYVEFIGRKNDIEAAFTDKLLDGAKKLSYYIATDGRIYIYSKDAKTWQSYTDGDLKASSLAATLLANEVNKLMIEDAQIVIDFAGTKELARDAKSLIGNANSDIQSSTALLLDAILDADDYSPDGAVYRESIVNALNRDATIDKKHNDSFAASLTVMAKLYVSLTEESSEASIDTIMDNFHLVGRLLDSLKAMESTSAVPEIMLDAIMQNKNYGKFFSADAVQKTLENIKDGKSTYEELFTTVQGVYGLASGIIPT